VNDEKTARMARLLGTRGSGGGGVALPDTYRRILTALHEHGPASDDALHQMIREQLGYMETRIIAVWGSWEGFYSDILLSLADGGFTARVLDGWMITEKAKPSPAQNTILRDGNVKVSVTFFTEQIAAAREAMAKVRKELHRVITYLEEGEHHKLDPELHRAYRKVLGVDQILAAALRGEKARPEDSAPDEEGDVPLLPPSAAAGAKRLGQTGWYRHWCQDAGWHTQLDARAAWNLQHPGAPLSERQASAFRHAAREMIKSGLMISAVTPGHPKGALSYRYTGIAQDTPPLLPQYMAEAGQGTGQE
jgi:hypothetical protein